MQDTILVGRGRDLVAIPEAVWHSHREEGGHDAEDTLGFMSADHHRVRNFAVSEIPRLGIPLPPELIAERLGLPAARVTAILEDLERHMTFVFRDPAGAVAWAYPVSAVPTPHRLYYSTGEDGYAA